MARKYMLDPNETVRVVIFVDTRNGLVVHQHKDVYERVLGTKNQPAEHYGDDSKLPEGIYREWADFAKPSFSLQQEIEQETIDYSGSGEDTTFKVNLVKQLEMKLKYLLRKWSLDEDEPKLKLTVVKDAKNRSNLTPQCMNVVMNQVQPAVIAGFLTAYNWIGQKKLKKLEEEVKKEVEEATGIPAPN